MGTIEAPAAERYHEGSSSLQLAGGLGDLRGSA